MGSLEKKWGIVEELAQVSEVASYLWQRGWAERNGGNLSINYTDQLKDKVETVIAPEVLISLPEACAGMLFFVTGTGCYMRTLIGAPEQGACILRIAEDASGYTIVWGGDALDFRPTSELISHLKIHFDLVAQNSPCRALVHTHPTELVALSHHPELSKNEKLFNKKIWSMSPESRYFIPRGVALIPYAKSGSELLADLTVDRLRSCDVAVWLKHGALAVGESIVSAFDFLDVANKSATIYLLAKSAGFEPVGLSDAEMDELMGL